MWNSVFSAPEIIGGASRRGLFWRGIFVFLLGLLFALKPFLTILVLATFLGWGFFISGIWIVASAFLLQRRRIAWCVYGSLFFVFGALLLMNPMVEIFALAWSIAVLFISGGVIGISVSLAVGNASNQTLFHFVTSVLGILLGCMLFIWPLIGLSELIWVVGVLLGVEGAILMVLAFRIPCRQDSDSANPADPADPPAMPES